MVFAMCCHIIFHKTDNRKAIELYRCTSVGIETTWKNLINTATIELPRNIKDFDKHKVKEVFKRGDAVTIKLGYNGILNEEFTGYITNVSADIPIKIKLEDEMYKIKKLPVNYASNDCYLPNFIKEAAKGYQLDVAEYNIGSLRFPNTTLGEVLQKLKDDFNLYSYFQKGKLVVGKIYSDDQQTHNINLERIVENNLEYKTADDKSIKLIAKSTLVKGEKIQIEIGDKDGEVRELAYFNITNKEDLKAIAQKDYDKYMSDGFDGNIETFGNQFINHGDKLNIESNIYTDRNGQYYCDSVTVDWQQSYYHRKIEVGQKVTK